VGRGGGRRGVPRSNPAASRLTAPVVCGILDELMAGISSKGDALIKAS